MEVDPSSPPGGIVERNRFQYAFCSTPCRERFQAEPQRWLAVDPVCGMEVNPKAPRGGSWNFRGQTFQFCSMKCLAKFQAEPEKFLAGGRAAPEIWQRRPGRRGCGSAPWTGGAGERARPLPHLRHAGADGGGAPPPRTRPAEPSMTQRLWSGGALLVLGLA
jgi:YHS domain-containing protein